MGKKHRATFSAIYEKPDRSNIAWNDFTDPIRSMITFQGRTPEELEASFHESVDLYLQMCEADGVSPEKPYSGKFNVRISPELHGNIAIKAASERKSLNEWIADTLSRSI